MRKAALVLSIVALAISALTLSLSVLTILDYKNIIGRKKP